MKTNKQYRKHNGQFARRYEGFPMWIGILFLIAVVYIYICYLFRPTLISPAVSEGFGVQPVYAQEPSVKIGCEDVVGYIRCKFYKGEITEVEAKTLIAIAKAESGLKERAKNRHSTASGVFQIVAGTWYSNDCVGDKWNFKDNTDCAVKIMKSSGFYPWAVYNNGAYKKFLNVEI